MSQGMREAAHRYMQTLIQDAGGIHLEDLLTPSMRRRCALAKQVVQLFADGKSYEDIVVEVGSNLSTVELILRRYRKQVERRLEDGCFDRKPSKHS